MHKYQLFQLRWDPEGPDEPTTFQEGWNHPNDTEQEEWRKAITKEFQDMTTRDVWDIVPKVQVPKDRTLVDHRWVFKRKNYGQRWYYSKVQGKMVRQLKASHRV